MIKKILQFPQGSVWCFDEHTHNSAFPYPGKCAVIVSNNQFNREMKIVWMLPIAPVVSVHDAKFQDPFGVHCKILTNALQCFPKAMLYNQQYTVPPEVLSEAIMTVKKSYQLHTVAKSELYNTKKIVGHAAWLLQQLNNPNMDSGVKAGTGIEDAQRHLECSESDELICMHPEKRTRGWWTPERVAMFKEDQKKYTAEQIQTRWNMSPRSFATRLQAIQQNKEV